MQAFEYANPATLADAVALLAPEWGQTEVLAGGTDLIGLMKDYVLTPKRLVNIKNIKELTGIRKSGGGLRIGALVTMDELARNVDVRASFKALSDAAEGIPSPQIRHMGTVGGDLCQRPRCWYFRNGFGLLAVKDGKSLVPDGENQYHAIFGGGPAYFVSASSLGPALVAMGARVKLVSAIGTREAPASSFFLAPKDESAREIALRSDEILTEIVVPAPAPHSATYEVRQKESLDWPLVAASVTLTMKGEIVTAAKIVLGHVAPVPWPTPAAEKLLIGKSITVATAEAAGSAAAEGAQPLSQNAHKIQLVRTSVKRALLEAAKGKA